MGARPCAGRMHEVRLPNAFLNMMLYSNQNILSGATPAFGLDAAVITADHVAASFARTVPTDLFLRCPMSTFTIPFESVMIVLTELRLV
jgi:hypothetical protein